MDIAVDTSAIIAVITNELERAEILRLTMAATLLSPPSLPWEVGNAFSAMFKRQRVTEAEALDAFALYRRLKITIVEVDVPHAIKLAAEHNIYAYDAYIITCALAFKCPLISLDNGLKRVAVAAGVPVIEVKSANANVSGN